MTMSVTISKKTKRNVFQYDRVRFVCVSASDGSASGVTTDRFTGDVVRLVITPGTAGDQPTNLFDLTVKDADNVDVLGGGGANISNAAATIVTTGLGFTLSDALTLALSNAGDTKTVTVDVYLKH